MYYDHSVQLATLIILHKDQYLYIGKDFGENQTSTNQDFVKK